MQRNVVVTGGAVGIGRAIAERFIAAGDSVWITGRRAEILHRTAKEIDAHAVVCDASDPAQVEASLAMLPEQVHVVVNNAGGNTDLTRPPAKQDLARLSENWIANFTTNVLTAVLTTESLAPRLSPGASVILFSSIAADRGFPGSSYGPAKAALKAWNLDLSAEFGLRDITSNVVAPGLIDDTEFFHGGLDDERRTFLIQETRTKRAGTVGDIAETVYFLASPGARHITGQVIRVNGGAFAVA